MLLLMHCLVVILCFHNLTLKYLVWRPSKINVHDAEFKDVLQNCKEGRTWNKFVVNDGFVFRANKLYIPASSVHLLLLQEAHGGG